MNQQGSETYSTCSRCGKPSTAGAGSITQWISGCKCAELMALGTGDTQQAGFKDCATCGKKIESGRPGSLTQWVFRKDLCSCFLSDGKTTSHGKASKDFQDTFEKELSTSSGSAHAESEIAVDADRFSLLRYAPLAVLGKGAGGTVYLCRDRMLKQKVAIKCLNNLTSHQLLSFQMEAKATDKLNHPNIVKVKNLDITDTGAPYMVMEYFPSVSLASLIEESGGLAWEELSGILSQIVDGLAYAHKNGVFHRDLKPSNILLQQSGSAPLIRIIDFGVAMVTSLNDTTSQGRTLVGTPMYMSPDQASGIAYDARSEIYSLGCLLFETATGVPPFQGFSSLDLINQHATVVPPSMRELSANNFPPQFANLVARMLEKSPSNRPQNMEEVRKSLKDIEHPNFELSKDDLLASTKDLGGGAPVGVKSNTSMIQILSASAMGIAIVGLLTLFVQLQNNAAPEAKPDLKSKKSKADTLRKFKTSKIEFFEPGRSQYLLTDCSPREPLTDEDLRYTNQAMKPGCEGIALHTFSGIKGEGIKYLRDLDLQSVDATGMELTHAGWKYLSNIKSLRRVVLAESNISDTDLKHFGNHKSIYELVLRKCNGITDDGMSAVLKIPHLTTIDLSYTPATDRSLTSVGKQFELLRVELEGTKIGDQGVQNLRNASKLFDLRLALCPNITGKSLEFIAKTWPNTICIEVGGSSIKPEDLEYLRPLKNLSHLYLDGITVTDRALQIIGTKSKLKELYITRGRFSPASLRCLYPLKPRLVSLFGCQGITGSDIAKQG